MQGKTPKPLADLQNIVDACFTCQDASKLLESTSQLVASHPKLLVDQGLPKICDLLKYLVREIKSDGQILVRIDGLVNQILDVKLEVKPVLLKKVGPAVLGTLISVPNFFDVGKDVAKFSLEICKLLNFLLSSVKTDHRTMFRDDHMDMVNKLPGMLARIGDIDAQIHLTELLFRLCANGSEREQYGKTWFKTDSVQNIFVHLSKSGFEVECRRFLNELNQSLGNKAKVHTFPCKDMTVGNRAIVKPTDKDYSDLWIDFNEGSKNVFLFCANAADENTWDACTVEETDVNSVRIVLDEDKNEQTLYIGLLRAAYLLFDASSLTQFPGVDVRMTFGADVPLATALKKVFGFEVQVEKADESSNDFCPESQDTNQTLVCRRAGAVKKRNIDPYPLTQGVISPEDGVNLDVAVELEDLEDNPAVASKVVESVSPRGHPTPSSEDEPCDKNGNVVMNSTVVDGKKSRHSIDPPTAAAEAATKGKKNAVQPPVIPEDEVVDDADPDPPKSSTRKRKLFDDKSNFLAETQSDEERGKKQTQRDKHLNSTVADGKKSRLSVDVPSFAEAHCIVDNDKKKKKRVTKNKQPTKKAKKADARGDSKTNVAPAGRGRNLRNRKPTNYKEVSPVSGLSDASVKKKEKLRSIHIFSDFEASSSDGQALSKGFSFWKDSNKTYGKKPVKSFLKKSKKPDDVNDAFGFATSDFSDDNDQKKSDSDDASVLRDDSYHFQAPERVHDELAPMSPVTPRSVVQEKPKKPVVMVGDVPSETPKTRSHKTPVKLAKRQLWAAKRPEEVHDSGVDQECHGCDKFRDLLSFVLNLPESKNVIRDIVRQEMK